MEPVKSAVWDVRPIVGRLNAGPPFWTSGKRFLFHPLVHVLLLWELAFTTLRLLDYPLQEAPEGCEGLITPCCLQSAFNIHQLWVPLHPQLRVSYVFSLISNLEDVQTVILADIDGELTVCRAVFPESLFYVLTHLVLTAVPRGRHCHFQVGDCGWSGVTELEGREDRTSWRTVAPEQVPSPSLARPPIYQ